MSSIKITKLKLNQPLSPVFVYIRGIFGPAVLLQKHSNTVALNNMPDYRQHNQYYTVDDYYVQKSDTGMCCFTAMTIVLKVSP